jgi:hypothetical protein
MPQLHHKHGFVAMTSLQAASKKDGSDASETECKQPVAVQQRCKPEICWLKRSLMTVKMAARGQPRSTRSATQLPPRQAVAVCGLELPTSSEMCWTGLHDAEGNQFGLCIEARLVCTDAICMYQACAHT